MVRDVDQALLRVPILITSVLGQCLFCDQLTDEKAGLVGPFSITSFRLRPQGWLGARQGSTSFIVSLGSTNASQQLCNFKDPWLSVEQITHRASLTEPTGLITVSLSYSWPVEAIMHAWL